MKKILKKLKEAIKDTEEQFKDKLITKAECIAQIKLAVERDYDQDSSSRYITNTKKQARVTVQIPWI